MIKYQRINSNEREVISIFKSHSYPAKRIAKQLGLMVTLTARGNAELVKTPLD